MSIKIAKDIPSSLSPSQLAVWLTCEQRWHYSYVDELKAHGPNFIWFAKGSYIHELLHYYYGLLNSGFLIGDDILMDTIKSRIMADLEEADKESKKTGEEVDFEFFKDVTNTVIRYVTNRSPMIDANIKFDTMKVEEHLEYEWDGRNFHGFMDLLYYDTDVKRMVVRDHKTGGRDTFSSDVVYRNIQLKMYATLFYKVYGELPLAEVNWLNSNPPKNPKKTKLYGTYRAEYKEETLQSFWKYLQESHVAQRDNKPRRNLAACNKCAYFPICDSKDKGLSVENIVRGNYLDATVYKQNTESNDETTKMQPIVLG